MLKELNARTLPDLSDQQGEFVINRALQAAMADIDDRGEDGKPRVVNITVTMVKDRQTTYVDIAAKATLPARRSKMTELTIHEKDGKVACAFQDMNSERVDQPTFKVMDSLVDPNADGEIAND